MKLMPLLLSFLFLFASCTSSQDKQKLKEEIPTDATRRAGFDLGSGSFRVSIADVKDGKIIRTVELPKNKRSIKLLAAEDLQASKNGKLSAEFAKKAEAAVIQLQTLAKENGAKEYYAIATGAFRKAKNGRELMDQISKKTGLPIRVVSGEEEAAIGFYGAAEVAKIEKEKMLVWDIGGTSMQMAALADDGKLKSFSINLGAVPFKGEIVKKVKKKNAPNPQTPNPMNSDDIRRSIDLAAASSSKLVPADIKKLISTGKFKIVGIGGVHSSCIVDHLEGKSEFSADDLANLVNRLGEGEPKTDEYFRKVKKSNYPETEISNVVLVLGFMRDLGIKKIQAIKLDNTTGLLATGDTLISPKI